jgi:glycosyltransferase involved in cell wall biosynthesis
MIRRPRAMSTSEPLVTVLVACRNTHPGFLELALASVLGQSSPGWRLLVIDHASDRQETLAVLRALEDRDDPRVLVIRSDARYLTGVLNAGLRAATTPFVCVLHADDLLDEHALDVLNDAIAARPDVDYFYSARRFIDELGRPISGVYPPADEFSAADFAAKCPVKGLHCWRVAAALAIGGMDEELGLHGGDDWDFPWRMAEAGFRFGAIPECLYLYRDHREDERLTTHVPLDVQVEQVRRILAKHGLDEAAIDAGVEMRVRDYLRQALFRDASDRVEKEASSFDPRAGWREAYKR